jgi:hypothetical protein
MDSRTIMRLIIGLASLAAAGRADVFIFDPTTVPISGYYVPDGAGHYNYPGAAEEFMDGAWPPGVPIDSRIQSAVFETSQGFVPENPNSSLPCVGFTPMFCYNIAQFFVVGAGTPLSFGPAGLAVYDSSKDLLDFINVNGAPDAIYNIAIYSGIGGAPIDLSTAPAFLQLAVPASVGIVATGSLQNIIEERFYDGTVDTFQLGPVPEPSSVFLLLTVLLGFGAGVKRRFFN